MAPVSIASKSIAPASGKQGSRQPALAPRGPCRAAAISAAGHVHLVLDILVWIPVVVVGQISVDATAPAVDYIFRWVAAKFNGARRPSCDSAYRGRVHVRPLTPADIHELHRLEAQT